MDREITITEDDLVDNDESFSFSDEHFYISLRENKPKGYWLEAQDEKDFCIIPLKIEHLYQLRDLIDKLIGENNG